MIGIGPSHEDRCLFPGTAGLNDVEAWDRLQCVGHGAPLISLKIRSRNNGDRTGNLAGGGRNRCWAYDLRLAGSIGRSGRLCRRRRGPVGFLRFFVGFGLGGIFTTTGGSAVGGDIVEASWAKTRTEPPKHETERIREKDKWTHPRLNAGLATQYIIDIER